MRTTTTTTTGHHLMTSTHEPRSPVRDRGQVNGKNTAISPARGGRGENVSKQTRKNELTRPPSLNHSGGHFRRGGRPFWPAPCVLAAPSQPNVHHGAPPEVRRQRFFIRQCRRYGGRAQGVHCRGGSVSRGSRRPRDYVRYWVVLYDHQWMGLDLDSRRFQIFYFGACALETLNCHDNVLLDTSPWRRESPRYHCSKVGENQ